MRKEAVLAKDIYREWTGSKKMQHTYIKALWFSRKFIMDIPYAENNNCLLCSEETMAEFLKNLRTPYKRKRPT